MNEAQTRIDHIDPALRAAGWGVVDGSRIRVEQTAIKITDGRLIGGGRRKSSLKADYVLEYRNKRLAVIEAKDKSLSYTEGVGQAKDYDPKQQAFLNFVLHQYIKQGVSELDDAKLGELLELNYGAISDAKEALGSIPTIRETFIGFQEHLYRVG